MDGANLDKLTSLLIGRQYVLFVGLVGIGVIFFMFLVVSTRIGYDVRKKCDVAVLRYGGSCVDALSETLLDEENSYGDRNSAIWALGQLGDEQALPVLESLYTEETLDRDSWNGTISQYELKKAIGLAKGGINVTHFVWSGELD